MRISERNTIFTYRSHPDAIWKVGNACDGLQRQRRTSLRTLRSSFRRVAGEAWQGWEGWEDWEARRKLQQPVSTRTTLFCTVSCITSTPWPKGAQVLRLPRRWVDYKRIINHPLTMGRPIRKSGKLKSRNCYTFLRAGEFILSIGHNVMSKTLQYLFLIFAYHRVKHL